MGDTNMTLWEKQMDKIIEKYEEETGENYFGYDSAGRPYTREDARSSYEDSLYHESREEE